MKSIYGAPRLVETNRRPTTCPVQMKCLDYASLRRILREVRAEHAIAGAVSGSNLVETQIHTYRGHHSIFASDLRPPTCGALLKRDQ